MYPYMHVPVIGARVYLYVSIFLSEHSLNATPTKAQPSPLQFRGQGQAHPQGVAFTKTTVLSSELPRPQFGGTGQPEDQGTGGFF